MDEGYKITTSQVVIRAWVEDHGGKPALIVDPNRLDTEVGLRIDFPGKSDESLLSHAHHNKDVAWEEFFTQFEKQQLAFEYLETPGETDLVDAYRFLKRAVLNEKEVKTPFDPDQFAKAIRDDEPAFFTHDGKEENPHEREIPTVEPDNAKAEEEISGDSPDPESDDDTTESAKEVGYLEPDDPQEKHDQD